MEDSEQQTTENLLKLNVERTEQVLKILRDKQANLQRQLADVNKSVLAYEKALEVLRS